MISGESVEKLLIPELTYTDLDSQDTEIRQTYLWSILFAAGYLTDIDETSDGLHRLVILNKEVLGIYEKKINSWFKVKVTSNMGTFDSVCKEAMRQIEDHGYTAVLKQEEVETIHKYGIACYKKRYRVMYRLG